MANRIKIAEMTIAMKNRILAIPSVAAERPEKPKKPATTEITKKISAHFNNVFFHSHWPAPLGRTEPSSQNSRTTPIIYLVTNAAGLRERPLRLPNLCEPSGRSCPRVRFSRMAERSSYSTVTPTALREQADRAWFYAHMFEALRGDDAAVQRLRAYAVELDAQAAALQKKAS
jgi:hypothetical protein